jgi:mono/diheme cytochrome c family protein
MKRISGWTLPVVALGLALAAPRNVSAQAKPLPTGVTAAMVETGKGLFHAAALCSNCHGPNGEGTGIAPNLADKTWLHSDGAYEAIVKTIDTGVPAPKESMIPMLPKGGSGITADQVKAVAAYVWSLSNK